MYLHILLETGKGINKYKLIIIIKLTFINNMRTFFPEDNFDIS